MITLVLIRDGHAAHNVEIRNIRPEERPMYERLATRHGYQVAVRKPKEPTCDNCANMAIRQNSNGENYRRCELFGQAIPDNEQSPSCSFHSAVSKFERLLSSKGRTKENTFKKGGAK